MKQILLICALVAMVGCGKKTTPAEPETNAEPKVEANKPEPPKTEPKPEAKIPTNAFVNTLGMPFVPVPGTEVAFCIWETRVKDYAAYAAANAGVDESWKKPFGDEFKQADTHPVAKVNWNDANAFCAWLTKKELAEGKIKAGQKYRLPTDAEWSVAVGLGKEKGNTPKEKSQGIKDVYPWGKEWPPPVGAGNYSKTLKVDKFDFTAPVGSFTANQFGLHDM
ncbi:MAG: SUMF1/EgtB/PvdO family nonheme iron enzyme, partial [Verrucomicrobiales bacterium]|nr:SUMF1/EgtB/PvdO family nonheme iron enzyme [Verrucomicrobiales bacterium]